MPNGSNVDSASLAEFNEKVISIIAKQVGFDSMHKSALNAFSAQLDLSQLVFMSHRYAELGGRCKPNYHDITRALEEAGFQLDTFEQYLQDLGQSTSSSPLTKDHGEELEHNTTEEPSTNFLPSDDEDDPSHNQDPYAHYIPPYVPKHLPSFPSRHSFRQTPVYIQRPDDPQKIRELNSQQSRTVEENLKRFMTAENLLSRNMDAKTEDVDDVDVNAMTIINYEVALQRRNRKNPAGFGNYKTTLQAGDDDDDDMDMSGDMPDDEEYMETVESPGQ